MDIVQSADSKRLEDLAVSFAIDFLKLGVPERRDTQGVRLYGSDEETLSVMGKAMEKYFKDKGEKVPVNVEIVAAGAKFDGAGYHTIDVGYFMRQ